MPLRENRDYFSNRFFRPNLQRTGKAFRLLAWRHSLRRRPRWNRGRADNIKRVGITSYVSPLLSVYSARAKKGNKTEDFSERGERFRDLCVGVDEQIVVDKCGRTAEKFAVFGDADQSAAPVPPKNSVMKYSLLVLYYKDKRRLKRKKKGGKVLHYCKQKNFVL